MSKPKSPCDRAGAPRRRPALSLALAALGTLLAVLPPAVLAGATQLSSVPLPTYTVGASTDIKPNIFMLLDDSGSMDWDYLPDWATSVPVNYKDPVSNGSGSNVLGGDTFSGAIHTPPMAQYLFYNATFNGVAYNPAITYSPPVTFTTGGAKDTTTYPSMNGKTAATGADTTKTLPNWYTVLNDGFKVQGTDPTSTSSLMDNRNAYFYTTVAGEYCDSPALTNCKPLTAAQDNFAYPAPLRWCTDQLLSDSKCRGLQGGTDNYIYPRMAAPRIATFQVTGVAGRSGSAGGSISGITVNGKQIMSATALTNTTGDKSGLASTVAARINACTYATSGNCTTVGYFAVVSSSDNTKVTIYAPGTPPATPASSIAYDTTGSASATITAFASAPIPLPDFYTASKTLCFGNNCTTYSNLVRSTNAVAGDNLRTVLNKAASDSYPYPGQAKKASTRADCAADTCTYNEEMTNYANWWAYYRTRMQMMKSATSRAFGSLDSDTDITAGTSRYRVGYATINNNNNDDFINIQDFDKTNKNPWFSQLLSAKPNNSTPLREALSNAGRLYGGVLNGVSYPGTTDSRGRGGLKVVDPVQYSCQKNYTILSTDGYWNSNDGFKLNGSTAVGNQDGAFSRPYSDGSATKLQKSTSTLQKRTETRVAEKGTLQKQLSQLQAQTSTLQQMTLTLQKQTAQLQKSTALVLSSTSTLQKSTQGVMQSQASLQKGTLPLLSSTASLQKGTIPVLQSQATLLTASLPVYSSTSQLQSANFQFQISTRPTNNGTFGPWTGTNSCSQATRTQCQVVPFNANGTVGTDATVSPVWTDVTSGTCVDTSNNIPNTGNFTKCRYAGFTTPAPAAGGVCTWQNPSAGSVAGNGNVTYSRNVASQCSYGPAGAVSPAGATCIWKADSGTTNGSNWNAGTACSYTAYSTPAPATSCIWTNQTTATTNGTVYATPATQCSYGTPTGFAANASCTWAQATATTNGTVYNAGTACAYSAYTTPSSATSCTWQNPTTSTASGTVYKATAAQCSYGAPTGLAASATCTWTQTTATADGTAYSAGVACGYSSFSTPASVTSCTWQNPTTSTATGTAYKATATQCSYAAATTPAAGACTWQNPQTATADSTVYNAAMSCSYAAFTTPAAAGGSCTYINQSTATTNGTAWAGTATKCTYAGYSAAGNAGSCTQVTLSTATTDNTSYKDAVNCTYQAWSAPTVGVSSCSDSAQTTSTANNTAYNASPVQCSYAASGWSDTGSCSKVTPSVAPNYTVGTARDCAYTPFTGFTGVQTCTNQAKSPGPTNFTVGVATVCQTQIMQAYQDALSCVPDGNPDLNGNTTQCAYRWDAKAATQTCLPAYLSTSFNDRTVFRNCASDPGTNNWVSASSCTISAPDTNGQYQNCSYTAPSAYSDDPNCTGVAPDTGPSFAVATAVDCRKVVTKDGTLDTLADVAAYYYNTDLRNPGQASPDATGTCTSAINDSNNVALNLCTNNVPAFGRDVNPKQHMTTHTLGLGATGYMVFSPYQNDLAGIRKYVPDYWNQVTGDFYSVSSGANASPSTGICPWQTSGTCNWPTPAANSPANIDDLWHAAVNGHGTYFSATDPSSLADALTNVLGQITNTPRPGTAAAAASSNPNITSSDNYVFSSSYKSVDWYGELIMQRFNTDGSLTPQQWSAMRLMDCSMTPWQGGKNYVTGDVYQQGGNCYLVLKPYKSDTTSFSTSTDGPNTAKLPSGPVTRAIYTATGGSLVSFDYTNLDATQKTYFDQTYITAGAATGGLSQFCSGPGCLDTTQQAAAAGQPLIDFLKGVRSNEGLYFRTRSHILGDIVSSEARYVKAPLQGYTDTNYAAYATAQQNRNPTVYVGSNDGMLHAFDALTGQERWAFVPPAVLPTIYHLADFNYRNNHRYYVDNTPEVGDICPKAPSATCAAGEWKTILVGGLSQGGKSFYALDITDPANPKFLWEYANANMGYSYSNPRLSKLGGTGVNKGTWVAMVASGYNNHVNGGDGKGHLFVLNAATGALISDVVTGSGDTTTPSGLSRLAARAPIAATDNTVEEVYGGDLNGNMWRFDVNDTIGSPGVDAQLLITLKDPAGNPQPITAKPTVAAVNSKPLVIIGTGRYLGTGDLTDTTTNTMYAIKDELTSTAMISPRTSGSKFVQQTLTEETCPSNAPTNTCIQGQVVRTSSSNSVDWSVANGWYMDLVVGGERSVTDATLALGTLVFTTIKPQSATADQIAGCSAADTAINAKSYLYYLDYLSGGAVEGTKNVVGEELCTCIATRPSVVKTVSGNVEGIIRTSGGDGNAIGGTDASNTDTGSTDQPIGGSTDMGSTQRQDLPYKNSGSPSRRISWRELNGG